MIKLLGEVVNNELPDVETKRLLLRKRHLSDLEAIFAYASLPEVSYPAGFPPVKTLEEEKHYLETILPRRQKANNLPAGYGITLKGENKIIGSVDFNNRHADDVLEIGYLLHPDYWGQGIMSEAVDAFLAVGFDLLGLQKIELNCFSYNERSQAIAEKCGFTLEARLRDRRDAQGQRCDDLRYGLLKSEWEERRESC